jgi:hypothetical protein
MNSPLQRDSGEAKCGWTRVSSFKPHLAGVLVVGTLSACLLGLLRSHNDAWPLITAGTAIALGLIALNCKVVYQRGNEYRVSTLFYSEFVKVDDVCMTVTNPGPLWTRFRIHLRRPARFGWMVSFVPAQDLRSQLN